MKYAQVLATEIVQIRDRLPASARRLDTNDWVLNLREASVATQEACGWFKVVDTPKPADPDYYNTWYSMTEMVGSVPTLVWYPRARRGDEMYPSVESSMVAASRASAQAQVAAGATPEQIAAMAGLFPDWSPDGVVYEIDDVVRYQAMTARCVQAHTSQAGWEPPAVPALWTLYRPPGVALPWVQPLGASDAYQIDELVTHNDETWVCTIADNVWEPGVTGWDVYVEPEPGV